MMREQELIEMAYRAKEFSYAPYSNFHVGAALLTKSGKIFCGCNIENASYSSTNCAERTAVFKAVSEGEKEFCAIAIAGDTKDYLMPCGVCRQVLSEFCDARTFQVILAKNEREYKSFLLSEIFPGAFSKADLEKIKNS